MILIVGLLASYVVFKKAKYDRFQGNAMKYKIGQTVKVKNGVFCPDDSEFNLSGWTGRIIDLIEDEEPTIGIEFDSITLKNMPEPYIKKSEKDGLDWSTIYLYVREVEPTKSRDTDQDVKKIRDELEQRFGWLSILRSVPNGTFLLKLFHNPWHKHPTKFYPSKDQSHLNSEDDFLS
jgi:hypothetical protein